MMEIIWKTCGNDGHWCNFKNLTLPLTGNPSGVYIIWCERNPSRAVRIGQGNISDRLEKHRSNLAILKLGKNRTLRVTWAAVRESQRDGVERYLADQYNPILGDTFPDVAPIPVNLPL